MKKTANNVALETILFVVGGLQMIKVYDRENDYDKNPVLLYEGMVKDFISYKTEFPSGYSEYKIARSKVNRIDAEGDCIVFILDTKHDQY